MPLGDIEQEQSQLQSIWSESQTELLISTYVDHEEEMESRKIKKKDVWRKITAAMNKRGCHVTSTNVENKWNSLLKSHKKITTNKNGTESKRKTFQYFEEMEMILAKRHDTNPPYVDGSRVAAASKSHVAIRLVRSSSPKAGSSHIDNEKVNYSGYTMTVIAMIKSIHH